MAERQDEPWFVDLVRRQIRPAAMTPDEQVYLDVARAYEQAAEVQIGADVLAATPWIRAAVDTAWRAGRASASDAKSHERGPDEPKTWTLPDVEVEETVIVVDWDSHPILVRKRSVIQLPWGPPQPDDGEKS